MECLGRKRLASPFSGGSDGKESACNAGDLGLIPGLERFPGKGNGYPLQCSCLENLRTEERGGLQSMGWQKVRHEEQLTLSHSFHNVCIY